MVADSFIHENTRNSRRTPTATGSGHFSAESRPLAQRGGRDAGCFPRCRLPMARGLSTRWPQRLEGQTSSGAKTQADRSPTAETGWFTVERSPLARLPQRAVDSKPCSQGNPQALRRRLRPLWRLACTKGYGLELSETRTSSPRRRPKSSCPVAKQGLARFKKTPEEAVVASFWSTNRALCSSRLSAGPGHPKVRPLSITVGTEGTGFRLFRPLASLRKPDGWVCTLISLITTSSAMISNNSSSDCWTVCREELFWSSTGGRFIDRQLDDCSSDSLAGFRLNGCQRMLRSLTQWRASGTEPSTWTWPTSSRTMCSIFAGQSVSRCGVVNPNNTCCDLSSNMLISDYERLLCLFKGQ